MPSARSRYHEVYMEELAMDAKEEKSLENGAWNMESDVNVNGRDALRSMTNSRTATSLRKEVDELDLSLGSSFERSTGNQESFDAQVVPWASSSSSNVPLAPLSSYQEHDDNDDSLASMTTGNDSLTTMTSGITSTGRKKVSMTTLIAHQDGAHVMRRIKRHPRSIRHRHNIQLNGRKTRAHPLHHAVSWNPPVYIVDAMIEAFPEACRLPDRTFGQLPLHIACNFRADTDVLRSLLNSFPQAVKLTDAGERLPLHYACHDGDPNNVSLLISVDSLGLGVKDINGKSPVDMLRSSQSPYRNAILKQIQRSSSNESNDRKLGSLPSNHNTEKRPRMSRESRESERTLRHSNLDSATRVEGQGEATEPKEGDTPDATEQATSLEDSTVLDGKRKKKPRRKSFSGPFKNLRTRAPKKKESNDSLESDHSLSSSISRFASDSIKTLPFMHRRKDSDINDDSMSSMSSLGSRLGDSLNRLSFQRPQLDVQPPRANDEMDSALIPWLAAGATIEAPTRGTALSIRRPRAQLVDRNQSMPARPRYLRKSTTDSEEGHQSLPSRSYSEPDAIDTNLVKDGYKGYKELRRSTRMIL